MKDLIKKLETADKTRKFVGAPDWNITLTGSEFSELLDELKSNEWIPVSVRLPERGETMLFCTEHGYASQGFLSYDAEGVWIECFTSSVYDNVTHWKPINPPNT